MTTETFDFFNHAPHSQARAEYWETLSVAAHRGWGSFGVGNLGTQKRQINVKFSLQDEVIRIPDAEEVAILLGLSTEEQRITLSTRPAALHHELHGFPEEPVIHFDGTFGRVFKELVRCIPDVTIVRTQ